MCRGHGLALRSARTGIVRIGSDRTESEMAQSEKNDSKHTMRQSRPVAVIDPRLLLILRFSSGEVQKSTLSQVYQKGCLEN
jgi:hypothetical protein